jgi:hypothetical protein
VLPSPIDAATVHVHDLYFLPLVEHLAGVITPHLSLAGVTGERSHAQRFRDSIAESLLRPDLAVGWDRGRRHEASLSQYVPFSAHLAEADGTTTAFGVMLPPETARVDVERVGDLEFAIRAGGRSDSVGLRIVVDSTAEATAAGVSAGRCRIDVDTPAAHVEETTTAIGSEVHLRWPTDQITGRITVRS